jgi:ABC-type amino acid transport substrate-binding protein
VNYVRIRSTACIALLVMLCLVLVAGCGDDNGDSAGSGEGDALARVKDRGHVIVGAYSYAPYSELVSDEWEGFYRQFTDEIAKKIGVDATPVFLTPAAFIPAVESKRVDTVIGLSYTPERKKSVKFSKPMMYSPNCIMVRDDESGIDEASDLDGKVLGLTRASAGESIAQEMIKAGDFTPKDTRTYDTYEAPIQDIIAKRIDAGFWDVVGAQDAATKSKAPIKCIPLADPETGEVDPAAAVGWVFTKGPDSDSLLAAFNKAQTELQEDGTFARILKDYGLTDPVLLTGKFENE